MINVLILIFYSLSVKHCQFSYQQQIFKTAFLSPNNIDMYLLSGLRDAFKKKAQQ